MAFAPEGDVHEQDVSSAGEIESLAQRFPALWVNVDGLGDAQLLQALGELFGLHPLALEDVLHVQQRPKIEPYGEVLFVVLRMPHRPEDRQGQLDSEQLSMFVTPDVLLTFQERQGDCFEGVRARLRQGRPRIRSGGPGYLAYALLDAVVDAYFPELDHCTEVIEDLEEEVLSRPRSHFVSRLYSVRRNLLALLRMVRPLRDLTSTLAREDSRLISEETRIYLRDCHDHVVQLTDAAETQREFGSGLLDVHLSLVSQRMNETMKVLTIMASIFIPLSFLAGVYGMNFEVMPELGFAWGYPAVLMLMALVAAGQLLYFRRRGWLGAGLDQDIPQDIDQDRDDPRGDGGARPATGEAGATPPERAP